MRFFFQILDKLACDFAANHAVPRKVDMIQIRAWQLRQFNDGCELQLALLDKDGKIQQYKDLSSPHPLVTPAPTGLGEDVEILDNWNFLRWLLVNY